MDCFHHTDHNVTLFQSEQLCLGIYSLRAALSWDIQPPSSSVLGYTASVQLCLGLYSLRAALSGYAASEQLCLDIQPPCSSVLGYTASDQLCLDIQPPCSSVWADFTLA